MNINQEKHEDLLRAIFDGIPSFIFVVDGDVRIHEYNAAAASLLSADRSTVLKRRGGEALHCLNSNDVPKAVEELLFAVTA